MTPQEIEDIEVLSRLLRSVGLTLRSVDSMTRSLTASYPGLSRTSRDRDDQWTE